jgi:hypothetical protein
MRTLHNVRLAAILAVGAFALHQMRYLIAPADLAAQGHGYMTDLLAPTAALVLAVCLATVIRGTEGAAPARAALTRRIARFSIALLAIYAGQETLEALMATGHPAPAAMLGGGGWLALPLALGIGALAALLVRALEGLERAIAVAHSVERVHPRPPAVRGRALPAHGQALLSAPLAFGLARRPPPPAPA